MADTKIELQEQILRHRVSNFLTKETQKRKPMQSVLSNVYDNHWPAYLFGGVARDLMQNGLRAQVRDVDVVVAGPSLADMHKALMSHVKRPTRFGGLHMEHKGWLFDMWTLADTWAFRESHIADADFCRLPQTTFLNVEAIAIELDCRSKRKREIYSNGFFEGFLTRTVEINLIENPYPALCILRSLLTTSRLNFSMGPHLTDYIIRHCQNIDLDEIMSVQQIHYGRIFLNKEVLWRMLNVINDQYRINKQSNVRLPGVYSHQLALWDEDAAICR